MVSSSWLIWPVALGQHDRFHSHSGFSCTRYAGRFAWLISLVAIPSQRTSRRAGTFSIPSVISAQGPRRPLGDTLRTSRVSEFRHMGVFSKTSVFFPAVAVGETSATRSVCLFSLSGYRNRFPNRPQRERFSSDFPSAAGCSEMPMRSGRAIHASFNSRSSRRPQVCVSLN